METKDYIPKNGEQVWIKVFSNWSKGTYIGLDADGVNHIVREPKEGGGNLLKSKDILHISANPNNNKHVVDWASIGLDYNNGSDLAGDIEYNAFYGFLDWLDGKYNVPTKIGERNCYSKDEVLSLMQELNKQINVTSGGLALSEDGVVCFFDRNKKPL